jgi:hypothetical protein
MESEEIPADRSSEKLLSAEGSSEKLMLLGITIKMKVVFGSVSENCDSSLADLAQFSLIP